MAKQTENPKYQVKPEYVGKDAWVPAPAYERKDGGKFTLNESLSDIDLAYLAEVVGYEGVEIVK